MVIEKTRSSILNEALRAQVPVIVGRVSGVHRVEDVDIDEPWLDATARLVDFVIAAAAMRRSKVFIEYVVWLDALLRARGASVAVLRATLEAIRHAAMTSVGDGTDDVVGIIDDGLACINDEKRKTGRFSTADDDAFAGLSKTYLDLLLQAKRKEAVDLVMQALDHDLSLEDLYLRVLQPAMRQVGLLWQLNEISVAQEHYVSAATQLIVSQLYPRLLDGPRHGRVMIAGCVAANLHEIGLRFLCDIFELHGWDTHFYGANTPPSDLQRAIRARRPNIVAIGATLASQLPSVATFVKEMRRDLATANIPILVGGAAFWGHEELWREMGADGYASDASSALNLADQLTGAN